MSEKKKKSCMYAVKKIQITNINDEYQILKGPVTEEHFLSSSMPEIDK